VPGRRDTLLDFFEDLAVYQNDYLIHDDGYRGRCYTYTDVARAARGFAQRLRAAGIGKGDKVVFWSENRPEWIAALWGCLLEGVIAVPVDFQASGTLVAKIHGIVQARALLYGEEVAAPDLPNAWRLAELDWRADPAGFTRIATVSKADIAEIIFTSGATAEPKGVILTHGNILANIVPVEREILKYRKYGRPFFPLRFLNLLPLSHMFGQAMAAFIPPMLAGQAQFLHGHSPKEIARQTRTRRISVIVSVPKMLDVLREHVVQMFPETAAPPPAGEHWVKRWWRYRRVHAYFGYKFWAFVVGAAPLERELEEFWGRLGFVVIQGYGLTETAPIVTLNHPFHSRKGTAGRPIGGVEVKIAPDGEILVRGGNVTPGYYGAPSETSAQFEDGWLHTGDIGEMDETGSLTVRGRKKEMIVTPDGRNVFPEDVERVLNAIPGVRESAVVGEDRVHAVLVLDAGAAADEVVREANARLEDHQKVRAVSVWPGAALPRTEGTLKLKRREVQSWLNKSSVGVAAAPDAEASVESIVSRFAGNRPVTAQTTLDELGLSSLERVELMLALEQQLHASIDEGQIASARTVGDLLRTAEQGPVAEPIAFPAWNRSRLARVVRSVSLATWILPILRIFLWVKVEGREHLDACPGPVLFAANHQSHMDTPAILIALRGRRRYHTAPAMAKEYFDAHFFPQRHTWGKRLVASLNYYLSTMFFFAFPLPQREAGMRQTVRYMGELVSEGESLLIFPEGRRALEGEIDRFRAGVALIASRLGIPVIPVRLVGIDKVLHTKWKMAKPGSVTVKFGAPLLLEGDDFEALARRVEDAVRGL
jgi:long-chain acyl-CoA synthetase